MSDTLLGFWARGVEPMPRSVTNGADGEHHGDFDLDADRREAIEALSP
jgi:hypothetical protein